MIFLAITTSVWAIYAPISVEDGPSDISSKRQPKGEQPGLQSVFTMLTSQQLARPLRPNIEPPIIKQDKPAPKAISRHATPLKTRLTLIGTVIQPTQKHAVLKGAGNESLVVFEGKELPTPNAGVILSVVGKDSVTLKARGSTYIN